MTELMFKLRRSPRTLLERDGHPGPGAGKLALVLARAGVGKTAFLVGIGVDALLSGQRVLHVSLERSVEKVRDWYDDLLMEMLRREKKLQHWAALQLETERNRHIQTYIGHSFSVERLRQAIDLLVQAMDFTPSVIIFDRVEEEAIGREDVAQLREVATGLGAELWMACRTHRDGPPAATGHLPSPAETYEDLVDLAFGLEPQEARVRLHVLKDNEKMVKQALNVVLDPKTLLLMTGLSPKN